MFSRGQLHQQCCEEWTRVSEETQAKMARMAAAAAWGLGNCSNISHQICHISSSQQSSLHGAFWPASVCLSAKTQANRAALKMKIASAKFPLLMGRISNHNIEIL